MAWIESHQSLSRHRKTLKTAGRLSVDRHKLIGHLMELWWWAIDNVGVDGKLTEMTHIEIAAAAQWEGDPQEFLDALIYGEFIDNSSEGLVLHDWYDYAGKLIEAREKERERSRKRRKATGDRPMDSQRSTDGTVPDPTVPNLKDSKTPAQAQDDDMAKRKAERKRFVDEVFEKYFWPVYPRKRGKNDALKAFRKLLCHPVTKEQCQIRWKNICLNIDALLAEGRPPDKIPYPATFLRKENFDEPPAEIQSNDEPEYEWVEVDENGNEIG